MRDIGPFSDEHEFAFHDGLTLLHGRNGIGKSTLALAMMMTLAFTASRASRKKPSCPSPVVLPCRASLLAWGMTLYDHQGVGPHRASQLRKQGEAEPIAMGDLAEAKAAELAFGLPPQSGNFTKSADEELHKRIAKSLRTLPPPGDSLKPGRWTVT